jgi:molybdate/tungstate transport system substrate-binding protein
MIRVASLIVAVILVVVLMFSSMSIEKDHWTRIVVDQSHYSASSYQSRREVLVMYAGSLVKTFEDNIGHSFEKKTGYTYMGEGRGSLQIANMILDGQRRPDVFVSAGTIPIKKLINATTGLGSSKSPFAQWLVKFASAELVIAYHQNSHFHSDLEKVKNGQIPWYYVLSKPGFKFGRTDPELDPKGYYMIMTAKLANLFYRDPTIKQKVLGEDRNPKQLFPEETLITTLETGHVDAIATYKHEAVARGLAYITLPHNINLSDPSFSDFYKKASYTLGNGHSVLGGPIYFAVTIPQATVKNLNGAISFVSFLLSPVGESILEDQGLKRINPVFEGNMHNVPSSILRNKLTS